ncbi:MAG: hypothetical protein LBP55_05745 [Candidatus Adiutrix sp.]|nr:hypothetical protein [Candidatus Adiutrix sp.]
MNLVSDTITTLTLMSQAFWSSVKENGLEQLVLAIAALVGLLILAALVGFTKRGKAVTPGKRGADITKFKEPQLAQRKSNQDGHFFLSNSYINNFPKLC